MLFVASTVYLWPAPDRSASTSSLPTARTAAGRATLGSPSGCHGPDGRTIVTARFAFKDVPSLRFAALHEAGHTVQQGVQFPLDNGAC